VLRHDALYRNQTDGFPLLVEKMQK